MTDIWDTLWGFWDAGKVDPFALETCFPDFIKKIRAEGDRLKEKGEKYDLIANNYFEVSNDGTTWNTTNLSRVIEAVEKLEAVKTHLEDYPDEKDDKYLLGRPLGLPHTAGPHVFNSVLFLTHLETWHKGLKKILEAGDV